MAANEVTAEAADGPVAVQLVRALEQLGVRLVFGLPGVHNLALWSALRDSPIELVGVRHEQTAAYAADGQARVTDQLGVALTTTGPGAANAIAATGEAWASGSPVLVLATDIPSTLRRPGAYRGVLHETRDQAAMFAPVVKRTFRVSDPAGAAETLLRAGEHALRAPAGPVYVEIPTDFLSARAPQPELARRSAEGPVATDGEIARAAQILQCAARPLLWVGGGAARAGAGEAVQAIAQRLAAPVIETFGARGLVSPDHPCWVGYAPHFWEVGDLWDEADAVLAIGTDFDGTMTQNWAMPQPPALVSINVSGADAADRNYRSDVAIVGDARETAGRLFDKLAGGRDAQATRIRLAGLRARLAERLEAEEAEPLALIADLEHSVPADTAVAVDMCIAGYWVGATRRFTAPRRLGYPLGWGTLGFGFPASIGMAIARAAPTLCVCGDGGFLYAVGELAVVAEQRPALTVLIVDDGGYGMLRYDQRRTGQEPFGVDFASPDFVALARSFGVPARRVASLGEPLRDALAQAIGAGGPTVLVLEAALGPPPNTSPRWYRAGGAAPGHPDRRDAARGGSAGPDPEPGGAAGPEG
jgi:acetolactate synthase-1/2/3 large subunit